MPPLPSFFHFKYFSNKERKRELNEKNVCLTMNEGRKEDRRGLRGKPGICGSCHVTTSSVCFRSKRSQRNREYIKTSRCCGMQTLSQLCWFFVLYDDQWDPDVSGMSGRLCTCGSFYVAVSSSDNRLHRPDLRIFRLVKSLFFFN